MRAVALLAWVVSALDLSNFVGTQHFQPCYYIDPTVPCLIDGAVQIKRLGSRIFKFLLGDGTPAMYPFNNKGAYAWPKDFGSLVDVASTPQIRDLLSNKFNTDFATYVMWTYSIANGANFCNGFSQNQAQRETDELAALTTYLMKTYQGTGMSFNLEHWEGDWAVRCGNYNASQPPNPTVLDNFRRWLQARQTGVDQGRQAYCRSISETSDCEDGVTIMNQANVFVYNGCEVNLVLESISTDFPNLIRAVIPHVALDYVSYSSYDTMGSSVLSTALDFIFSQLNRTTTSPKQPVFITEWGLPLNQVSEAQALEVANNVVGIAAGRPYVSMVLFWQVINNELLEGDNGNCASQPVFDPTAQRGFWAVLPNGTLSFYGSYLQGLLNGSRPIPPPQ